MVDKINFNWAEFRYVCSRLSKTEETVIAEHFKILIEEGDDNEYSSPEMQQMFDQFRSSWIMSQMFTK